MASKEDVRPRSGVLEGHSRVATPLGGRAAETDRPKRRHRAPARPHLGPPLDEVNRRRQQQIHAHRGHKNAPLFRLRRVLRVGQERLNSGTIDKIFERLRDTDDEVAAAWIALDLLRRMYQAPDRDTAHRRLVAFYEWAVAVEVPEVNRMATTTDTWQDEVLAFFDTHTSNAPTDQANVKIKSIRRAACGFRNSNNCRARILLHAGQPRRLPTTTRIRSYNVTTAA